MQFKILQLDFNSAPQLKYSKAHRSMPHKVHSHILHSTSKQQSYNTTHKLPPEFFFKVIPCDYMGTSALSVSSLSSICELWEKAKNLIKAKLWHFTKCTSLSGERYDETRSLISIPFYVATASQQLEKLACLCPTATKSCKLKSQWASELLVDRFYFLWTELG